MWYATKKEILESLGKNEKDVRYLDRAIARGEIIHDGGMYILMRDYVEELRRENSELKGKLFDKTMGGGSNPVESEDGEQIKILQSELNSAEKHIKELEAENGALQVKLEDLSGKPSGSYSSVSSSDLDFQIEENERLEGEKSELIEGVKQAFFKYNKGGNWEIFKQNIGLGSLLEDIYIEE